MLQISEISKTFDGKPVLDRLSLQIEDGEIFTILGASGCGKTTLLRIIAGLETPDSGTLSFNGQRWIDVRQRISVPPQLRGIGLVFQSYAIWPHMHVFGNVAYPLRNRKMPREAIQRRVAEVLRIVGLEGLENRPATRLSGGQQQRVAMARAIAADPKLLLLDEPFSNLDVGLRKQMRLELRQIQKRLNLTVVLVTHDQADAFTLSDRIAVLDQGRVEQVGSSEDIYDRPRSDFVRRFIGNSVCLRAVLRNDAGGKPFGVLSDGAEFAVAIDPNRNADAGSGISVWVRPEHITLHTGEQPRGLGGRIRDAVFVGDRYETLIELDCGQTIIAYQSKSAEHQLRERITITFDRIPVATTQ